MHSQNVIVLVSFYGRQTIVPILWSMKHEVMFLKYAMKELIVKNQKKSKGNHLKQVID